MEQKTQSLPALGEAFNGGKYAGITTDKQGNVYALVLLGDKPANDLNWKDAMAWAEGLGEGASLPNRVESAMLFANLKGEFEESWHWTNEAFSERSAWFQLFGYGDQLTSSHDGELCARAVRRFPINPSIL